MDYWTTIIPLIRGCGIGGVPLHLSSLPSKPARPARGVGAQGGAQPLAAIPPITEEPERELGKVALPSFGDDLGSQVPQWIWHWIL